MFIKIRKMNIKLNHKPLKTFTMKSQHKVLQIVLAALYIPLIACAILSLIIGLFSGDLNTNYLN